MHYICNFLDYWTAECTVISSTTAASTKLTEILAIAGTTTPREQQDITITPSSQQSKIVLERRVDADDTAVYHLIVACTIVVGVTTVFLLIICVICIYKQHFKSYCKRMDFEQGSQKLEFIRKYSYNFLYCF